MTSYEQSVQRDLTDWRQRMRRRPSAASRLSKALQQRLNRFIPDRVRQAITVAIKQMTRAVLFGSEYLTPRPVGGQSLEEREAAVRDRIDFYRKVGAAEGGLTGAGGILLSLADFPLLLSLKMKMLFDIAALYGYATDDFRERIYILSVFQLAFSGPDRRQEVVGQLENWTAHSRTLPDDIHRYDWQTFQEEYRDYIDLAKLAQLIPGIGAAVGLVVNYRLLDQLGTVAMQAYRLRWFANQPVSQLPDH